MDLRDGDTVASVAVIREGRLSRVEEKEEEEAELETAVSANGAAA
jgi:hypothetical protein